MVATRSRREASGTATYSYSLLLDVVLLPQPEKPQRQISSSDSPVEVILTRLTIGRRCFGEDIWLKEQYSSPRACGEDDLSASTRLAPPIHTGLAMMIERTPINSFTAISPWRIFAPNFQTAVRCGHLFVNVPVLPSPGKARRNGQQHPRRDGVSGQRRHERTRQW